MIQGLVNLWFRDKLGLGFRDNFDSGFSLGSRDNFDLGFRLEFRV